MHINVTSVTVLFPFKNATLYTCRRSCMAACSHTLNCLITICSVFLNLLSDTLFYIKMSTPACCLVFLFVPWPVLTLNAFDGNQPTPWIFEWMVKDWCRSRHGFCETQTVSWWILQLQFLIVAQFFQLFITANILHWNSSYWPIIGSKPQLVWKILI